MTQPRVRARVTRLALIGWAVAVTASAQGLGTLTGTVTTPAGIPVEGLRLTFTRTDTVVTAVTDGAGDYRLEGLQPGLYDPTIDDPEQAVEPSFPVTVVADITIRRDFTLRSAADVQVRLRGGDRPPPPPRSGRAPGSPRRWRTSTRSRPATTRSRPSCSGRPA